MATYVVETTDGCTIVQNVSPEAAAEFIAGCEIHYADSDAIKVYSPLGRDLICVACFDYGPQPQADIDQAEKANKLRRSAASNAAISGEL